MKSSYPDSDAVPKSTWLMFGAILLLAAGLRLTRLGLVEFKYDEATTARSAVAIAREGRLPAVGMISSQGAHNPALMSYVLAVPFAISRDPRLAAGWVALLGVAAVGMTYWLGCEFFNRRVGTVAAVLFAASPWAVFQSRKIWTQNLPLVTLLFAASVLTLVARRKPWALVAAMATAGCLFSLHLGGLTFFFVLGALLILFHEQVRPRPLLLGLGALVLILLPYVLYDARHGWDSLRALRSLGSATPSFNLRAFTMAARVASGYHLQDLAGSRHVEFVGSLPGLLWIDLVEIALFWLGLLWAIWRVIKERMIDRKSLSDRNRARVVLLFWFLVPVGLLLRRAPVQPHDFNLLYPVQHLIIAAFLADVEGWLGAQLDPASRTAGSGVRALIALLILVIVVWQIAFQQALLTFVDNHDTPGGHGAPVKYALAAARRATDLAAARDATLITLLPGGDPRYNGSVAVFDVLLPSNDRRLVDGRKALVLPERMAVYLSHPQVSTATALLESLATPSGASLALRAGSGQDYRFFRWEPNEVSLGHPVEDERYWTLPSDETRTPAVRMLSYRWEGDVRPGQTFRWITNWQVEGAPPANTDVHWFNHLVDEQGIRWGQRDGAGLPVSKWRSGDIVITWFDISIAPEAPPPPYRVRTGLYTYPNVVNLPLVDESGNPAGQFLELGPIYAH